MYRCGKCKKEIKTLDAKFVRCPYCGWRILYKGRQPVARELETK